MTEPREAGVGRAGGETESTGGETEGTGGGSGGARGGLGEMLPRWRQRWVLVWQIFKFGSERGKSDGSGGKG